MKNSKILYEYTTPVITWLPTQKMGSTSPPCTSQNYFSPMKTEPIIRLCQGFKS